VRNAPNTATRSRPVTAMRASHRTVTRRERDDDVTSSPCSSQDQQAQQPPKSYPAPCQEELAGLGVVSLLLQGVHLHAQGGVLDRGLVFLWQVKLALLLEAQA
jgi:hypothetical protein